ncbi:class II ribonucleotidereductase [Mycobacterium phage SWU1]|uniref:Gene 49 protein n=2 Tax=Fromanvirus TaxID=186764 RepID=VG49_BPML5|nr:ribonucleoside reductase class II [Fromanvirus L5]YP_006382968.1 ribonucleoside reductase class II [Mycobacterium phage SWU1]Q05261.1 RecName: Full=Gene 49 protein; AltName: Full=Gp49 [Fromanvirus L5]AFI24958.1 class II ribonucleotidereductase [Mycobacterium phage SWU1]CAA79425.1 Hypothetical Protein PBI_L5_49 [Fromanvirus L5]
MKGNQLSYDDPWSTAPAQPEPAPAPEPETAPSATVTTASAAVRDSMAVQHSTDGVSATFKFAGQYSDPWVVVKGADPADVLAKVNTAEFKALMDKVQQIAGHYAGSGGSAPANGGGGGQQQSRAPQAAQEAPGGEKRYCQHGEMVYKSGVSKKTGKPYALFSCTAPRDQQCDAQWPDKK